MFPTLECKNLSWLDDNRSHSQMCGLQQCGPRWYMKADLASYEQQANKQCFFMVSAPVSALYSYFDFPHQWMGIYKYMMK